MATWKKPNLQSSGNFQPAEDDEFNTTSLGLQWQFEGPYSHYWYFCDAKKSKLRLYGIQQPEGFVNLSDMQNTLMQKIPTENFTVTAKMKFIPNPGNKNKGEEAGFIIKGQDYAAIKLITTAEGCKMRFVKCENAMKGKKEQTLAEIPVSLEALEKPYTQKYAVDDIPQPRLSTPDIYVRAVFKSTGICNNIKSTAQFYYSLDGKKYEKFGEPYSVKEGKWIGAKVGFFNCRSSVSNDAAFLDVDWIRFTK